MPRLWTALLLAAAGWTLLPTAAGAATRNGMIAYEWQSADEERHGLRVMNPDGTGIRTLFGKGGEDLGRPVFSPDGNALLVSDGPLFVASLARDHGVRRVGEGLGAWSPDSRRVVWAQYEAATDTVDIHVVGAGGTGDVLIRTEPDPCVFGEFSTGLWWSAATDRIMYVCGGRLVSIEPHGSGRRDEGKLYTRRYGPGNTETLSELDLSYDGTRFAGELRDGLATWDWTSGAVTDARTGDDEATSYWATWAPEGTRLLFAHGAALATAGVAGGTTVIGGAGGADSVAHPAWQPCVDGVTKTCEPVTLDASRVGPLPPSSADARPILGRRAARQANTNVLQVTVGCDERSVERCNVTVTARAGKLVAAGGSAKVAPGATERVRLELRGAARRRLARDKRLALQVRATAVRSDGRRRTATTRFTMRR